MDRNIVQEPDKAERVAKLFHDIYERLAPQFSYETRKASAKPWEEVPENNRKLMIATVGEVLAAMADDNIVQELCEALAEVDARTISERDGVNGAIAVLPAQLVKNIRALLAKAGFNEGAS